jgi:SAM-dependent methyltransferase
VDDPYAPIADLYDHVVPYRNRADVDFFVSEARASGGPVLEIGCGTGRVLIPTARAGVDIVGLDDSEAMLHVCRARLASEPDAVQERVRLRRGDMREFSVGGAFALVTLPFRPFQHLLTVEDQIACLNTIHRHLTDDGRIILDLFNPSLSALVAPNLGEEFGDEPEFTTPDGRRVVRKHRTLRRDAATQVNHYELIYYVTHPDGREERTVHSFALRYSFRFEVEHLLERCGFRVEHVYEDYDRTEFGTRSQSELILVGVKRPV